MQCEQHLFNLLQLFHGMHIIRKASFLWLHLAFTLMAGQKIQRKAWSIPIFWGKCFGVVIKKLQHIIICPQYEEHLHSLKPLKRVNGDASVRIMQHIGWNLNYSISISRRPDQHISPFQGNLQHYYIATVLTKRCSLKTSDACRFFGFGFSGE